MDKTLTESKYQVQWLGSPTNLSFGVVLLLEQMWSYIAYPCIRAVKKERQEAKLGRETAWNNQVIAQAWDNFTAIQLSICL